MQPDTDLCKIVILTQNNNNMLSISPYKRDAYMMKLTMYLNISAPRANNCLIQIFAQNNFAQAYTWAKRTQTRTLARRYGRKATISQKKPRSLTLVLDSFVPSARVMDREKIVKLYVSKITLIKHHSVVHKWGLHGLMGPNREITEDTWSGQGQEEIVFEEEPSDNILMDVQFR